MMKKTLGEKLSQSYENGETVSVDAAVTMAQRYRDELAIELEWLERQADAPSSLVARLRFHYHGTTQFIADLKGDPDSYERRLQKVVDGETTS